MILGNVIHWTGDFDTVTQAFLFWHAIDFHTHQIIHDDPKSILAKDELSYTDWHFLEQIHKFLGPFQKETLALEGYRTQGSLFDVCPSIETLYQHSLHTQTGLVRQSQHLNYSFQLDRQKIHKYYSFEELSPIICGSIVLQPKMDKYFEDCKL